MSFRDSSVLNSDTVSNTGNKQDQVFCNVGDLVEFYTVGDSHNEWELLRGIILKSYPIRNNYRFFTAEDWGPSKSRDNNVQAQYYEVWVALKGQPLITSSNMVRELISKGK